MASIELYKESVRECLRAAEQPLKGDDWDVACSNLLFARDFAVKARDLAKQQPPIEG